MMKTALCCAISIIAGCESSDERTRQPSLDAHCRAMAAMTSHLIDELHGPRASIAVQVARTLRVDGCADQGASVARACRRDLSHACAERAMHRFNAEVAVHAAWRSQERSAHCDVALESAAVPLDMIQSDGGLGVDRYGFATFDFETCGAGANLARLNCVLAQNDECTLAAMQEVVRVAQPSEK